jgi:hypothetical protein
MMDAWNALQFAYKDKDVNRRCILLGKLFDVKLKHFNNMQNYVTQVLKTAQEKALDNDLIATLLLCGLTPEYKPMCLALENSGVELTTDYIKMKLLQEGYNPNPKVSYSSENVACLPLQMSFLVWVSDKVVSDGGHWLVKK